MNAVAIPFPSTSTRDQASVRDWIEELTDLTPQQIEDVLMQMEQQLPEASLKPN